MNCLPIALQAGPIEENLQVELDLIGELAGSVIDFAARLKNSFSHRASSQQGTTHKIEQSETERFRIAQNPDSSASVLRKLSHDPSAAVRSQVIFNPSLDVEDLKRLAHDSDAFIRSQARTQLLMAA